MTTIVTRAGKGSALTWTEGDANITNLNNDKIEAVVDDTTPQLGGDLDVNGKKIVSASNGNIAIEPNGTGIVTANKNIETTADVKAKELHSTNSSGDEGGQINLAQAATNSTLAGDTVTVDIYQNKFRIFEQGGDARGVYIDLTAAATGVGTNLLSGGGGATTLDGLSDVTLTSPSSNQVLKYNSATSQWINGAGGIDGVYADTNPSLGGNLTVMGYSIVSSSNGNITIAPNGTGSIVLDGLNWPQADGSADQVLKTNGTGQLSWTTVSSGATTLNGLSDVVITSATAGDLIGFDGTNWINAAWSGVSVGNATNATNVNIGSTDGNASDTSMYVALLANGTTGNQRLHLDGGLAYNASTNSLSASLFSGALNGTVGATTPSTGAFTTISASGAITSTLATGTAPFTVSSTTKVANLNVEQVDGYHADTANTVSTIAVRDGSGIITASGFAGALNGTVGATTPAAVTATTLTVNTSASLKAINEGALYNLGTTGGTIAPNVANGNVQKITLNSALTLNAFTSPVAGQSLTLIIYGGTAYTSITSTMKFAGGVKTLTGTAGCIDILSVYYDGTNYFASLGKGFA